jgi:hypothetical protein
MFAFRTSLYIANVIDIVQIADALMIAGIPFVRFDGSMSAAMRKEVLERFDKPLDETPDIGECLTSWQVN